MNGFHCQQAMIHANAKHGRAQSFSIRTHSRAVVIGVLPKQNSLRIAAVQLLRTYT